MKTWVLAAVLALTFAGPASAAECYADYKAKRNNSQAGDLKLHYGVIALSGSICANSNKAGKIIARRIGRDGWILLRVNSLFGADGLLQRRANAGDFYLRY